MVWWLEGITFRHFGWVRNPSEANFSYFWNHRKNQKFFSQEKSGFFGKYRYLSENISIYRKNRRFFADFLPSDFSTAKSFPGPPKSDFSPKNRPISAIFLSLNLGIPNLSSQFTFDAIYVGIKIREINILKNLIFN